MEIHVDVTYDLATDQWTITPDKLPVKEASVIVFHRVPAHAKWTFQHIDGVPETWKQHFVEGGKKYHVHDPHDETAPTNYQYVVLVHDEEKDEDHHSPKKKDRTDPPIIMNEP